MKSETPETCVHRNFLKIQPPICAINFQIISQGQGNMRKTEHTRTLKLLNC